MKKKSKKKATEVNRNQAAYHFALDKARRAGFSSQKEVFDRFFEGAKKGEIRIPTKYYRNR